MSRAWYNGRTEGRNENLKLEKDLELEDLEQRVKLAEERSSALEEQLEESQSEIQDLRRQLSEASGREQALEGVIARHMRGLA